MSQAQYTREDATAPAGGRTFDADLNFLSRWTGPLGLLARAMLAYIFIVEGTGKIAGYAGVADYMQAHGVDGRLLPLVILTELGGGLLVLFGLKTRWAAIALFGFCLLTAAFFHTAADQAIQLHKNIAMAGGFLALALLGLAPGRWTAGGLAPSKRGGYGFQVRQVAARRATSAKNDSGVREQSDQFSPPDEY